MTHALRFALVIFALSALTPNSRAGEPGYIDFGKFKTSDDAQFVEVNLGPPLLKFAAAVVAHQDAKAAELIRGLKHVRVNVIGCDDSNREDTTGRVKQIRSELEAQGWVQAVTARDHGKGGDVAVYVKTGADDSIEGVVVTVLDGDKQEAVFVNVVGTIRPDQLAALGKGLHLECLEDLPVAKPVKGS